jgi:hypothetical protein
MGNNNAKRVKFDPFAKCSAWAEFSIVPRGGRLNAMRGVRSTPCGRAELGGSITRRTAQ